MSAERDRTPDAGAPDAPFLAVPLAIPDVGPDEIAAATRVLERQWLTMGEETIAFEEEFAALVGAPHAIAVSNCTAALHLALIALDVGPGDEVLVPSLSFVATANAVLYVGATPVFVDIPGAHDLNLDLADAERKLTARTRAIVAVHHSGHPADLVALRAFADRHGLAFVEDAAQAIGAAREGLTVGTAGDLACFSFYSTKNATTGEGGMVTTTRDDLAERVRLVRSHGMTASVLDRDRGKVFGYDVVELGYNYRIDEVRAAIGRVQLAKVRGYNARRAEIVARYRDALASIEGLGLPFAGVPGTSVNHLMPIVLPPAVDRIAFAAALRARGIQTSVHYRPIHLMAHHRRVCGTGEGLLPVTEDVAERELSLPLYPTLTDAQIDHVIDSIQAGLAGRAGRRRE